jgi:nucleotide-binding universal stress UspA family protein
LEAAIMFETILVPTDGSEHAGKALELATDIAEKYKARLVLLHVVPSSPLPEDVRRMARNEHMVSEAPGGAAALSPEGMIPTSTVLGTEAESAAEARRVRQFIAEEILAGAKRVAEEKGVKDISAVIEDGDPSAQILRHAGKEAADLIVMGSRGLGDLKGLLMGSVSHKVSQMSPCSCITVK